MIAPQGSPRSRSLGISGMQWRPARAYACGAYERFREVADPGATSFGRRFRLLPDGAITGDPVAGALGIDLNCDEVRDVSIQNPDFSTKRLRSNLVLRWEYRPGSTLFVIWKAGIRDMRRDGTFELNRDFRRLLHADGPHVSL